jgi:PhnB protein
MLSDELPGQICESPEALGGTTVGFYVYVKDVDEVFDHAVATGATAKRELPAQTPRDEMM